MRRGSLLPAALSLLLLPAAAPAEPGSITAVRRDIVVSPGAARTRRRDPLPRPHRGASLRGRDRLGRGRLVRARRLDRRRSLRLRRVDRHSAGAGAPGGGPRLDAGLAPPRLSLGDAPGALGGGSVRQLRALRAPPARSLALAGGRARAALALRLAAGARGHVRRGGLVGIAPGRIARRADALPRGRSRARPAALLARRSRSPC